MKKIFTLIIAVILTMGSLSAFADNEYVSGRYTYQLKKNGTAVITHFDWANNSEDVLIPPQLDGYTVVEIQDYAFAIDLLSEEFQYHNYHTRVVTRYLVTIPDSIVAIGKHAFFNCELKSINIPDNVQTIGEAAFSSSDHNNEELQFRISPNHPYFAVIEGALYSKSEKKLIFAAWKMGGTEIPKGIVAIGDYAMVGCHVKRLPDTVTTIGEHAMKNGFRPTGGIPIPSSVTKIGDYAFESSKTVNLGTTSINTIPEGAFYGSSDVIIENPEFIESIGSFNDGLGKVFTNADCFSPNLTTIPTGFYPATKELPETVKTIESDAFDRVVTDFKLPASLSSIAEDAFPASSTFIVESGSYAERWASENGITYTVEGEGNLDWLNN